MIDSIRVISFDLDDTLWEIWPVIDRAERILHEHICEAFPRIGENHGPADLRLHRNRLNEERPDLAHDLTELRRVSFERLLVEYGYDAAASHELVDRFLELRHDVTLFPDVLPALERLSNRFRLIAVSNGNADVIRLGIGRYFSGQVSARSAGVKKPDKKIFEQACALVDLKPEQILHVGDHPLEDVMGAQAAGLRAVWVNRRGSEWPHGESAHAEVSDLAQLVTLLEQSNPAKHRGGTDGS